MSSVAIRVEGISKQYRLGTVGTGTLSHDINRWWQMMRGKEDPFLKVGEENNRIAKGNSEYVWALKNIDFDVKQGEVLGIIGRNGAGKSTLLKILSRTTTPTTGRIKVRGRIASLLEVGTGFHPELTGRENIFLNGAILGMTKAEIKSKFDEIVDFSGVERYIDTPVKRYSSGMYVRLAFGVAAHLEPEILIVDEVLAVGDAEFQRKALGKMKDVSASEGRTVLFVSHNMAAINRLCSKAILMTMGKIDSYDLTGKIIEQYASNIEIKNEISFTNGVVKYLKIIQEGKELKIECHYETNEIFEIPHFGFVISDGNDNRIFGANPTILPPDEPFAKRKKGIIEATVSYPQLLNGIYNLSVWFGDGRTDHFQKENVLAFEVLNMTHYEAEKNIQGIGPVSAVVKWDQKN